MPLEGGRCFVILIRRDESRLQGTGYRLQVTGKSYYA
jgi:hypothetical protein